MKNKLFRAFFLLALFALLLITPIGRVSAQTEWNLKITNLANTTVTYSYDQLLAMPQTNISAVEYCYGVPINVGNWTGVSLSYLLQQAGLTPAVASLNFLARDGYAVSLQIQEAMQQNVIVAYAEDGIPLPQMLRLVPPSLNGNMWIAEITSIAMSNVTVAPGTLGGPELLTIETIPSASPTPASTTTPTPTSSPISSPSASPSASPSSSPTASPISSGSPLPIAVNLAAVVAVIVIAVFFVVFRKRRHKAV